MRLPNARATFLLSSILLAACGRDPAIGDWKNDGAVGPHGLDSRLTLLEGGDASYTSHGSSGLGLPTLVKGEWLALGSDQGVPRYDVRLGCRPPGMLDANGHCSSEVWVRSICSLENDTLSCPDGALQGALRFLRAAPEGSNGE